MDPKCIHTLGKQLDAVHVCCKNRKSYPGCAEKEPKKRTKRQL
jgi:hypothetical protein